MITDLLRDSLKFDGVVCTDWGIVSDMLVKPASAWGVEDLTTIERVEKVLNAGCDMFGGESIPDLVVELINSGKISESRINTSVRRVLRDKFRLGLFDNPYLKKENLAIFQNEEHQAKGREAQRRSLVLLKNENSLLPLAPDTKIYVDNLDAKVATKFTQIVNNPNDADVLIQRLSTPYDPRNTHILESFFHQGRLHYNDDEKADILALQQDKPTVTVMTMERPTIFPEVNAKSQAVIGDFECEDDIIFELLFGKFQPTGKLPFEIPSSVAAVEAQFEDVPYDSENPLYPFGYGISYQDGKILD